MFFVAGGVSNFISVSLHWLLVLVDTLEERCCYAHTSIDTDQLPLRTEVVEKSLLKQANTRTCSVSVLCVIAKRFGRDVIRIEVVSISITFS